MPPKRTEMNPTPSDEATSRGSSSALLSQAEYDTGRPPRPASRGARRTARWMFYAHLWLGVAGTAVLILITATGILLNHKGALGLMPEAADQALGDLRDALPLQALVSQAEAAVDPEVAAAGIDRMDVRPEAGLVKVRFDDRRVMEVTLSLQTGEVLEVGERNDVFLEKLHSGEIFGDRWILLSDAAAVIVLVMVVSGYWLWLYPKTRV